MNSIHEYLLVCLFVCKCLQKANIHLFEHEPERICIVCVCIQVGIYTQTNHDMFVVMTIEGVANLNIRKCTKIYTYVEN